MKKVLAIDMGATSIRGILAHIEDGTICTKEVMRISHDIIKKHNRSRWDFETLIHTIKDTMIQYSHEISSVAIDTWGVDFGYLDKEGNLMDDPISYRDPLHEEGLKLAEERLSLKEIFEDTGTQIMNINTLFQLLALRKYDRENFDRIDKVLMLPDLINYLLCGEMVGEETIWSTSQILNLKDMNYSSKILKEYELKKDMFPALKKAGIVLGTTKNSKLKELTEFDIKVVLVCGHDTASAVMVTKAFEEEDHLFLSCGTWSLFGTSVKRARLEGEIFDKDLTNELTYDSKTLLFKNITGLYLLEKYKGQLEEKLGRKIPFEEITGYVLERMEKETECKEIIDMDDPRFGAAEVDAKGAIDSFLKERSMEIPVSDMDYFRVIYESLASKYLEVKASIEELTGNTYQKLHMIGGGAKSELLCKIIAKKLDVDILAGPFEASALGNIIIQLKVLNEIETINEGVSMALKHENLKLYQA